MPFPSPPWQLEASAWLSLFAVRESGRADRPGGLYAAAFVDYGEGSVLTYHELLVARVVRSGPAPQLRITDIWVDSPVSRDGGRSLWAIPKELADLPLRSGAYGPVVRTTVSGVAQGQHLASATFVSVPGAALVRLPFMTATSQPDLDGGDRLVVTRVAGSSRVAPARASWRFDERGPLAFLAGRRAVASFHLRDASLSFG